MQGENCRRRRRIMKQNEKVFDSKAYESWINKQDGLSLEEIAMDVLEKEFELVNRLNKLQNHKMRLFYNNDREEIKHQLAIVHFKQEVIAARRRELSKGLLK